MQRLARWISDTDALLLDAEKELAGLSAPADIPKPAAKAAAKAGAAVAAGTTIHVVKPGETLFRVSRLYGVPIDKLKKWNKLPDDIIEVGQKLVVGME